MLKRNAVIYDEKEQNKTKRISFSFNKLASFYFPVTSAIMINSTDWQMAVLTDRAQGGSSL
jgi:hypothetical protein